MATAKLSGKGYVLLGAMGLAAGLVGAGLALTARAGAPMGMPSARPAANGVIVSSTALGDSEISITILDVAQQRIAVYLADAKRSRLKLLAVRDISADMALTDYNNEGLLPKDIRARLEKGADAVRSVPAPDSKPPAGP
jgi:parvulin-like peptidyl-prolyl isomerase